MSKTIKSLMLFGALLFPIFAHAFGEPYTQQKMDALNKASKPTLVFIYADWCPTCKAEGKVLGKLLPRDEFKGITTLKVNFDTQKSVVRAFGARMQSTLIVFSHGKEVSRMTGETDEDRIADLLRKSL